MIKAEEFVLKDTCCDFGVENTISFYFSGPGDSDRENIVIVVVFPLYGKKTLGNCKCYHCPVDRSGKMLLGVKRTEVELEPFEFSTLRRIAHNF